MENLITEKDLIEFGFERTDVSAEESGDKAFYYYTWDLEDFCLITHADDEAVDGNWKVEIFDYQGFEFTQVEQVASIINALKAGIKNNG